MLFSCSNPIIGNTTSKKVTIDLTYGYFGLCSKFFEGTKPVSITINVDRYTSNGNFESDYKTYRFNRNNDDNMKSNVKFEDIEVPKSGTFAVSVSV